MVTNKRLGETYGGDPMGLNKTPNMLDGIKTGILNLNKSLA